MTTEQYTTVNGKWHLYDSSGYLDWPNVQVEEYNDGMIRIGNNLHRRDDLTIAEDGNRIDGASGWYLTR